MTRRMYAWSGGTLVGIFERRSDDVRFEYDESYDGLPISLSMPLDGKWDESAPGRVLASKLPEDGNARLMQSIALRAPSDDPFDILPLTDAAGGLVFTRDETPPTVSLTPLQPCSVNEIEARVFKISSGCSDSWWPEDNPHARFSLAGSQGKFTLARIDGRWYWPTASCPSTHIFKPESRRAPGSCEIEGASMSLARQSGIPTACGSVRDFGGERCYVTRRFDRRPGPSGCERLRTEELMFAVGVDDEDKYGSEVRDIVDRMRLAGFDEDQTYLWISQVMLNMSVGNCDAHMRNYGVILEGRRPALSPMYDVVSTMVWPSFDNAFALMVNGQCMSCGEFTPHDWAEEAMACGLDPDRVTTLARGISAMTLSLLGQVSDTLSAGVRDSFVDSVREANRSMQPKRIGQRELRAAMGLHERDELPSGSIGPTEKDASIARGCRPR